MKRFFTSYLTLFFAGLIAISAISVFHSINHKQTGEIAPMVQGLFIQLVIALWIRQDAAKKRIGFPADLALLHGWIFPIYFLHSRGWKGCGMIMLIFLILIIGGIVNAFIYLN